MEAMKSLTYKEMMLLRYVSLFKMNIRETSSPKYNLTMKDLKSTSNFIIFEFLLGGFQRWLEKSVWRRQ